MEAASRVPDFEVKISGEGGGYRVAARSAAGETSPISMEFPFDDLALARQLQALELALLRSSATVRRLTPIDEQPVQDFGRQLFEFAFPPELRAHLLASSQQATQQGTSLRVQLRVGPPELAVLPWEFLYDPGEDDYLCLSTPLVRYLDVPKPRLPLTVAPPLRILAMVARPDDLSPLDADHESRRLTEAIADLQAAGRVRLSWVEGQTWWDLQDALDHEQWHVFHFIGHGALDAQTGEGVLVFAAEDRTAHRVGASDLALLLSEHRSLRLVVLNSCEAARANAADRFSSTASTLMRRGIPAVVAMQYEISDQAAVAFARGFYTALAAQHPVDHAVTRARRAIKLARRSTLEWATPVLYLRAPSGALFDLTDVPSAPGDTPPETAPARDGDDVIVFGRDSPTVETVPHPVETLSRIAEPAPAVVASPAKAARLRLMSRRRVLKIGGAASVAGLTAAAGLWLGVPIILRRSPPPTHAEKFDLVTVDAHGGRNLPQPASVDVFDVPVGSAIFAFSVIPAGGFPIGSPDDEPQRRSNEGPQQFIQFRRFALGRTVVTQRQWAALVEIAPDTNAQTLPPQPSHFLGDDRPVETVTWYQATEFCRRLSVITGLPMRLPSEAEWEHACRAGSTEAFHFGPTVTPDLANYCGTGGAVCGMNQGRDISSPVYGGVTYGSGAYAGGPVGVFHGETTRVASYPPNRFGLYEMHGNVWEHCYDTGPADLRQLPANGNPYVGPGESHVLRGGSWSHNPAICRSAYRDGMQSGHTGWDGRVGLRVVCEMSESDYPM